MQAEYSEIVEHFAALARRAGAVVQALQGRARVALKGPADRVTEADECSHEMIASELSARYPGVPLVMEEQANPDRVPGECIVVDELDGTNLYSCGGEEYALTLAWLAGGVPVVGVMYQPVKQRLFTAIRGRGAFADGRPVHLDRDAALPESIALFEINRSLPAQGRAQLLTLADRTLGIRCLGTAIGSAMELLSGRAGLYINWRGAKIWDFAAAALAVEEAGGTASDCAGEPLTWEHVPMGVMLCANASIARAALACSS